MSGSGGDLNNSQSIQGATDDTLIGNFLDRLKVHSYESELATFVSFSSATSPGNNKSMYSMVNAGGSSVVAKIREIRIINSQTSAVTGKIVTFTAQRITGHSAGTLITDLSYDTLDSVNSSVTSRTDSTVSGESSGILKRWIVSADEWGTGSQDVESFQHGLQTYSNPSFYQLIKTKPITLRAGEGFTIKCITNTTAGTFDIFVVWTQEDA